MIIIAKLKDIMHCLFLILAVLLKLFTLQFLVPLESVSAQKD